jgi:hypothetical protein
VKGIVPLTKSLEGRCYFSQKGEPVLDARTKKLAAPSIKPQKKSKEVEAARSAIRKALPSLKNVPWDCQQDGNVYFQLSTPEFVVMDPMTGEEDSDGPYTVNNFDGPGLYQLPVSSIKRAKEDGSGVAVDSGSLVFIDNEYLAPFVDAYDWDKSTKKDGDYDLAYHERIAKKLGIRFGICSAPPKKFKSQFVGDGFYRIDVKGIKKAKAK